MADNASSGEEHANLKYPGGELDLAFAFVSASPIELARAIVTLIEMRIESIEARALPCIISPPSASWSFFRNRESSARERLLPASTN